MNASPDSLLSDNFPESRPGAVTHELSRCLIPPKQNKRFTCISIFPWSLSSSATLWAGKFSGTGQEVRWRAMAKEWIDVGVIGCHGGIVIANVGPRKLSRRNIILDKDVEDIPVDAVAWALRESHPFSPLALFACNKCLYIVDAIAGEIVSVLRGHGGEIKSISVHPTSPHLVCTTSRDFSSRIYDLHKTPSEGIRGNLPWSSTPSLDPLASLEGIESLGGAPHGIHPTEPEGYSPGDSEPFGRCVLVLVGGRCGGHYDAVVHASFHPTLPLIATCGFDRAVKIWQLRLPKMDSSMSLLREDRPLFTTSQLHEAGVLSVFWTSDDTLLTHCMPMDHAGYERDPKPGSIIMWTWLGKNRFFPGGQPQSEERMRGVASDYLESSSFLILSQTPLPQSILSPKGRVNLYSHRTLGPIILMPSGRYIRMIKASELPIFDHSYRIEGPGVDDDAADAITEGLSNIHVDGELELGSRTDSIRGSQESPVLWTAAAGMTGSIIVALDVEGRVYVWHRRAPP